MKRNTLIALSLALLAAGGLLTVGCFGMDSGSTTTSNALATCAGDAGDAACPQPAPTTTSRGGGGGGW